MENNTELPPEFQTQQVEPQEFNSTTTSLNNQQEQPPQINQRMRRASNGAVSWVGFLLFAGGMIVAALLIDNPSPNFAVIGVMLALSVAGIAIAIYGDRIDHKKFMETRPPFRRPPANAFLTIGGGLIGLGLVGLLFIILDSAWDNTAWVVFELVSIGLGIPVAIYGWKVEQQRMKELENTTLQN